MANETNENRAPVSLEQQLSSLHADLQKTLRETRSRAARIGVLMTLLVLVIGAYWIYVYRTMSVINADVAADIVYRKTLEYANNAPPVLSKTLRQQAPALFDYAEGQILQSPALLSAYIRDAALQETQQVLDHSEPVINQVIADAVTHARTAVDQAGYDPKNPAHIEKMIDVIAQQIGTEMKKSLDKLYADYDVQAKDAIAYLNKVAAGQNLDQRQQHLRQVVISFLAVAEKRKAVQ